MPDTENSIDIEKIIATVAKKQKTIINPDDELLTVVLLNEEVFKVHLDLMTEELEKQKVYFEKINQAQKEQTKRIIVESVSAATEKTSSHFIKNFSGLNDEVESHTKLVVNQLNESLKSNEMLAAKIKKYFIVFSSVMTALTLINIVAFLL